MKMSRGLGAAWAKALAKALAQALWGAKLGAWASNMRHLKVAYIWRRIWVFAQRRLNAFGQKFKGHF
jgi:putative flippase GtrA